MKDANTSKNKYPHHNPFQTGQLQHLLAILGLFEFLKII